MKSCPACNRIYTDDTYTFCLDDGATLSAVHDSESTRQMAAGRQQPLPKTEILPPASAFETQPARANATRQNSETLVLHQRAVESRLPEQSNSKYWFIVGGGIAFILAGLVIALGYVAWRINDQTASKPSSGNSNRNVAGNQNGNTPSQDADDNSLAWLDGVWEGKGYQTNPQSTWTIRLTVQNELYKIEYPSLSCQGKWSLLESETDKAKFKEVITRGSQCENNGTVLIEKIDDNQISFKYSSPDTTSITSTAVLRKRAQATE